MVVLGVVLLAVALALVLFVALAGLPVDDGSRVTLELLDVAVETSAAVVFLMGAVALAVAELGLLAVRTGLRSAARRRAEMQRLRRVEAEVQARQAAHAQRNAHDFADGAAGDRPVVPVAPPAPPFARRDQAGGTSGPAAAAETPERGGDDPGPPDPTPDPPPLTNGR